MRHFLARLLITSLGLWLADSILVGMRFDDTPSLAAAALLLGIVNAIVRPVIVFLTFPITFLTLGFFLLVINGAMVGLVAWWMPSFHMSGLGTAMMAAVVVGVTSWFTNSTFIRPRRIQRP